MFGAVPLTGGEKEEAFDYYQDGQTGRGKGRVLIFDLGDGITMELVLIPAGKFQMGSPPGEKERRGDEDQHSVEIARDFYLGKYEVTRGQFRTFIKDTGYRTEPETDGQGAWGYNEETRKIEGRKPRYTWKSTGFAQTDEHPVVNVTWNETTAPTRHLAFTNLHALGFIALFGSFLHGKENHGRLGLSRSGRRVHNSSVWVMSPISSNGCSQRTLRRRRSCTPLSTMNFEELLGLKWPENNPAPLCNQQPLCMKLGCGWVAMRNPPGRTAPISSPRRPRRCGASWSKRHADRNGSAMAASSNGQTSIKWNRRSGNRPTSASDQRCLGPLGGGRGGQSRRS
jgi:hypothetical protein